MLNSYKDEPTNSLAFLGSLVLGFPDNDRAVFKMACLKLSRDELLERRTEKIRYLEAQLQVLCRASTIELREILMRDLLVNEMKDDSEYAATARSYLGFMLNSANQVESEYDNEIASD